MQQFTFSISQQHPSLAGHFPGHPVVPGVVLLDQLLVGVRHACPELAISGFKQVKFISPVLPNDQVHVQLKHAVAGSVTFDAYHADERVFTGSLSIGGIDE